MKKIQIKNTAVLLLLVAIITLSALCFVPTQPLAHAAEARSFTVVVGQNVERVTLSVPGSAGTAWTSPGTYPVTGLNSSQTVTLTGTAKSGYVFSNGETTYVLTLPLGVVGNNGTWKFEVGIARTVTVTVGTGIASIRFNGTTYTSTTLVTAMDGYTYTYNVTYKAGYTGEASGSIKPASSIVSRKIVPIATKKTFTISATFSPSYAPTAVFAWKMEWKVGGRLSGAPSDYVKMTVAADTLSVTLEFIQNFNADQIVLTCYTPDKPSVKATCTISCGSP